MAGNLTLADLGESILSTIVTVFSTAAVTLPDRQYLHFGEVAWDCDELVVSFTRMFSGFPQLESPGPETAPCGETRSVDFSIWLIRCVPSLGTPDARAFPTEASLTAAARTTLIDTLTLFYGLRNAFAAGTFLSACTHASFGPVQAVGPQGQYGGIVMSLGVEL